MFFPNTTMPSNTTTTTLEALVSALQATPTTPEAWIMTNATASGLAASTSLPAYDGGHFFDFHECRPGGEGTGCFADIAMLFAILLGAALTVYISLACYYGGGREPERSDWRRHDNV